jgi:hypothetical protein
VAEGFKAGSAYVELDVDADPAIAKTEKAIRDSRGRFVKAGTTVGEGIGDGIDEGSSKSVEKSPKLKKATEKVAGRTEATFQALKFAGAFAGLPVAAAGAAALTVGAFAAIPLALVAAAAKANAGIDSVGQAYTRFADTSTGVFTRSASVLQDELVAGTNDLEKSVRKLEPALTGAFNNSAPAVNGLVKATTTLVDESLPGILTGTTKTAVAMEGLNSLTKGVGRGVTDFFQNSARGADASAASMTVFGGIVQDAAGFLGTLVANLSQAGTSILPQFRGALQTVYGILEQVTSGGMSPLVQGVGAFVTTTTGALSVVLAMTSALGGWLGPLAAIFGAFKAADMLTFGKLTAGLGVHFEGLGSKIKAADGARAKFTTGMSALTSAAFSPAGLAVGALTIGLGLLGVAQQKAAADAAAHKTRIADLASALRESKGAIDDNVRAQAAKALQDTQVTNTGKSYLEVARQLGVSQSDLTSAYLGNASASERVKTALRGMVDGSVEWVDTGTGATQVMSAQGQTARDLLESLGGMESEFGKAAQKNKDLAEASATSSAAMNNMSPALAAAQQGAGKLASAYSTLFSPMASVADKANALITILDRLAGRTPSYEESVQSMNDTLRSMESAMASGMDQTKGWGDALLNADGTVSTFTENGSSLQNNLVQLQSGFANAGASIQELVEGGMTYNTAAQQVQATLQTQRDRFVELAQKMGLTGDQANSLADKYGLIPSKVVTEITNLGTAVTSLSQVTDLDAKIKSLPPNTPVRITSITAEAEQKLKDLGYTVTHMPDGTVLIMANTGGAIAGANEVESRVQAIQDKTVYVNVVATGVASALASIASVASRAAAAISHDGGRIGPRSHASGPAPRARRTGGPTPFLAGMANATLVGETGPEIIYPDRSSYVATAIQTKRAEKAARGAAVAREHTGGTSTTTLERPSVTNVFNIYAAPGMDIDALAAKVSRKVEQTMKGGA